MLRLLGPVVATFVAILGACAASPEGDPFDVDPAAGGGADGAGFPVLDIDVASGEQLTLEVAARPAGKAIEELDLADHMIALRVHGGPAAVIVRRTGGNLDAYALVKSTDKRTLASSTDQFVAPRAGVQDAIVTVASAEHLVLISGEDLASGGSFTLDVVAVPGVMQLESTPARILGEALRELEPSRAEMVSKGWIAERADGGLDEVTARIPLAERARVKGFVHDLGEARTQLFAEVGAEPAAAGAGLAAIWKATETP